jgi:hypothetical protein
MVVDIASGEIEGNTVEQPASCPQRGGLKKQSDAT